MICDSVSAGNVKGISKFVQKSIYEHILKSFGNEYRQEMESHWQAFPDLESWSYKNEAEKAFLNKIKSHMKDVKVPNDFGEDEEDEKGDDLDGAFSEKEASGKAKRKPIKRKP